MKVLHIINNLNIGGAEKLLVETLPLYESFGVQVDVFLLTKVDSPFVSAIEENFNGNIYYSGLKSVYNPCQILKIRDFIQHGDYDVVHAHLFPTLYWVSLVKTFFGIKIPIIFTEHSTHNKRLDKFIFRAIDRCIYRKYQNILAITPQVKQVLVQKLNINPEKVEVVYNGVEVDKYKQASPYAEGTFFEKGATILMQVSRFQAAKDQKTVIRALALLPQKYKLLLVGDGETKIECENLVQALSLQERVQFLGSRVDIPELLKTADIVIQSSHWEGFGLVAVEAMAAGKPIIASDVVGLRDIVSGYGLLFQKGNEDQLAKEIETLEDKRYYKEIADKCTERAEDFHITKMIKNNIAAYQQVINN
jgi:putative lipopolysaccharide biosynthesis protein